MAPDLRVFLASADRELAGLVADAPGLQLTGATADRAIAQAALASRRADVYVLDWRVAEVPEDLRAIDADIFAAAAVVAEGSPPLAGWERASARRRLFAEPYEPLEIVAWAQWLGETQHEYRSPPGPVQAAPPPLEVGAASSRAQAAAVLTSAPPSTGAPEGREERLRLRGLRPVPPGSGAGQPAAAAPSRVGRLVAVCSPKGGVGKTMVAANLSAALAGLGEDVLLTGSSTIDWEQTAPSSARGRVRARSRAST
ncbi:MAG: hypothetical protein IMW98_07610 [Firmicutes bacterium]|nr:hypothetical protein [Bacillota bacterium]